MLKKSHRNIFIAILAVALVYLLSRINIPFLNSIYKTYLLIPEWIANQIFRSAEAPVSIIDHELIFQEHSVYHENYNWAIADWTRYLKHFRWSVLIPAVIWLSSSTLRKKIIASIAFLFTHMASIVGGLFLIGVVYPEFYQDQITVSLSPTLAGNLFLFSFLCIWILFSKQELREGIGNLGINFHLTDRKIYEIVITLFLFFLLREFIIKYYHFNNYVNLLLIITKHISSWFGYSGYITGKELIGDSGILYLGRPCLGFMSFFLFGSFVFLTRDKVSNRSTILFITTGLIFLNLLNIARLVIIFIIAQGVNGTERASLHHEIYNVVIYIFIFALWVLWYERFVRRADKISAPKK